MKRFAPVAAIVVAITAAAAIAAAVVSCKVWGPRDNVVDPSGTKYQGYDTVASSAEIQPVSPADGGTLTDSTLTITPVAGAKAYELRIADSAAGLDSSPLFDNSNYASNVMDLTASSIFTSTVYYWIARTKDSSGSWGAWSKTFSLTTYAPRITTVAGNGTWGYSGDGGAATSAQLYYPNGVAFDSSGNLYIADIYNNRIRKVSSSGTITTVAGNGTSGYSGDNGAATSAQLYYPNGVAFDSSGNLYIADMDNNRIRKVSSSGTITTVAGNGTSGYSGDGGAATSAQLYYPNGVAFDSSGNLYIGDMDNNRIRKVSSSGTITTVAGNGTSDYSGDGGAATSAQLYYPNGVAFDSSGNLYIADMDNNRIRKVSSSGTITTVAGNGTSGYSGDGGAASSAELRYPWGVALDPSGNLYIADTGNNRIRKVSSSGMITTVAGNGRNIYGINVDVGDGGDATSAMVCSPSGIVFDSSGNLYIADRENHRIRKVAFRL